MNSAVQKYLDAASGLTNLTASKAEQIAKGLVRSGEAASDQVGEIVDELMDRQRKNREAMVALVKSETNRAVRSMGLATNTEVERLQKQVADLKRELAKVSTDSGSTATAKKTAKKSGKRTATTTGASETAAKKTAAKKTASKKTASKKTAAKKSTTTSTDGS